MVHREPDSSVKVWLAPRRSTLSLFSLKPFAEMAVSSRIFGLGTSHACHVKRALTPNSDQLTSLVFFLGNIYFVACSYHIGFQNHPMQICSSPRLWGIPYMVAVIPLFIRLVQSIRRWFDSGLYTHLINVSSLIYHVMVLSILSKGWEIWLRHALLPLLLSLETQRYALMRSGPPQLIYNRIR
jgi:hypothetical protein